MANVGKPERNGLCLLAEGRKGESTGKAAACTFRRTRIGVDLVDLNLSLRFCTSLAGWEILAGSEFE